MTSPLKIIIVCYPTYGGSGIFSTELGHALAARGHKIFFVSTDVPKRLELLGAKNVLLYTTESMPYPLFKGHDLSGSAMMGKLSEVIMRENPDLINVHYAVPFLSSALTAREFAKTVGRLSKLPKIIGTFHGTDVNVVGGSRGYQPDTMLSALQCDGLTVPSWSLRTAAYDKLRIPSSTEIEVIPNFVDTQLFTPECDPKKILSTRRSLKIQGKKPILCHVSNFRAVKRIGDVIKIFAEVNKKLPSTLVMVGDGPEQPNAIDLVKELSLEEQVIFLGRQRHFEPILQASDLFLFPSETESFGLAALEAMACGVPVVASDVGGIPEVVLHGKTGFLGEVGDISQMAEHCLTILGDKDMHHSFSLHGRAQAENNFRKDAIVDHYERYFYEIVSR